MKKTTILLAILLSGCTQKESQSTVQNQLQVGRYTIVQLGTFRRDQYLLDTATGQVWSQYCGTGAKGPDCDYSYWNKLDIIGLNTTIDDVIKHIADAEGVKKATTIKRRGVSSIAK